ncbi:MAG: hypothetical protein HQL82_05370 [Magnetococcales bacterium]|nr:hypothetical protein [Magnetococcales bacterium]
MLAPPPHWLAADHRRALLWLGALFPLAIFFHLRPGRLASQPHLLQVWRPEDGFLITHGSEALRSQLPVLDPALLGASLGYLLLVAACGLFFIHRLFGASPGRGPLRLAAALVPGYLVAVVINRLVTLILPHAVAPWVCLGLLLLTAILSAGGPRGLAVGLATTLLRPAAWGQMLLLAALGLLFLILGIQLWDHYLVGDSAISFSLETIILPLLAAGPDPAATLPLISPHYDKELAGYPLFLLFPRTETLFIPLWTSCHLAKVGVLALCYLLFRHLGTPRWLALLFCAFFATGTFAWDPLAFFWYWDAANPLGHRLATERVYAVALPLFFLVLLLALERREHDSGSWADVGGGFVLGMGVAATSLHIGLYVLSILLLFWLFRPLAVYAPWRRLLLDPNLPARTAGVLVFTLVLAYTVGGSAFLPTASGGILLTGALVAAARLSPALWRAWRVAGGAARELAPDPWAARTALAMALGLLGSWATLGNLPTRFVTGLLAALGAPPAWLPEVLSRQFNELTPDFYLNGFPFLGVPSGTHLFRMVPHYGSGLDFLTFFGPFLLFTGFTAYFAPRLRNLPEREWDPLLLAVLTTLALVCFALFLYVRDFMQVGHMPWPASRLQEIPFNLGLMAFFLLVGRYGSTALRLMAAAFAVIWTLGPLVATAIPQQWWANARHLLELLDRARG